MICKMVATLYLLFVIDSLICATIPVFDDSKVTTETNCPGFVVYLSLLLPFLFLQGFVVAMLYAHVRQKFTSVAINCLVNFPCLCHHLIFEMTNDSVSDAMAIIPFVGCHLFECAVILLFHGLPLQS